MPIYEYRCNRCGHELELFQKLGELPPAACPACEEHGLRKKISPAAFRLKGGGWYETDFKSDKQRNLLKEGGQAQQDKASGDGGEARQANGGKNGEESGKTKEQAEGKPAGKSAAGERSGAGKNASKGDAAKPAGKSSAGD